MPRAPANVGLAAARDKWGHGISATSFRLRDATSDPSLVVEGFQPAPPMQRMGDAGQVSTGEAEEGGGENDDIVFSGSCRKPRPSVRSVFPPRLSLRKETLGDLSSRSASLFSSIPPSSHDDFPSTVDTSPAFTRTFPAEASTPSKPSVTLPSILLHPEVREKDGEGEN